MEALYHFKPTSKHTFLTAKPVPRSEPKAAAGVGLSARTIGCLPTHGAERECGVQSAAVPPAAPAQLHQLGHAARRLLLRQGPRQLPDPQETPNGRAACVTCIINCIYL